MGESQVRSFSRSSSARSSEEDRIRSSTLLLSLVVLLFPFQNNKQYSFSLTTFSPSGKLVQVSCWAFERGRTGKRERERGTSIECSRRPLVRPLLRSHSFPSNLETPNTRQHSPQIEHALNAVNAGATALGIRAVDGVVLATEKKARSPLVDGSTISKLSPVTPNSGLAYAGMGPDSRVLVRRARKSAQAYLRTYGEEIPVAQLCRETAAVMQEFTQRGGVRPFGVSLLMAGVDAGGGPQLYQIDPSGSYFAWKASAVGKNAQDAR